MSKELTWGILGTGSIAQKFARGIAESHTGTLLAVGSRTQASAEIFGATWNVPHRHGSYEALLADTEVQAVYISTPHPLHAEWAIKAAEAGKHILCEKPIALNHAETMAIVEAAQRNDVFLMEAFMYRCHPQTTKLIELLREGAIGQVRVIQATFSFDVGSTYPPEGRLLNNALGGGGILDVGCYCASIARLIAGVASGKDFAEPLQLVGSGSVGETRVDEYALVSLKFPGEIVAELLTGVRVNAGSNVHIFGSNGSIALTSPFAPRADDGHGIFLTLNGQPEQQITFAEEALDLYAFEADTVARSIEDRQAPAMSWEDTLGNMRVLDQWRDALGVVYDAELPSPQSLPVQRRPLAANRAGVMKYGQLAGLEKPVSRLLLGVDNQVTWPHASVMFDDFFEQGGNAFDTAYIYGAGLCEKLFGQWVKSRNIREQVVILDKGAHTPNCNPVALRAQLLESLERLQVEYVDIYMLHRDNPEIPVGEFITVLNELRDEGRLRIFGGSNWSIERIEEANAWAAAHGMAGFSAMSNNFSLARMIDPIWAGCISASDVRSRAWLTAQQMPLLPWSSQARGFFTGRANPLDLADQELVRCWYSADNFQRLERVNALAKQREVLPINIALAYVLCQPFPTFPLIGPRLLSETRTSLPALNVELTLEELRWLNLEA